MSSKTVFFVSEQAVYRSGNQVLPEAIKGLLCAGFRVILLIRDWTGTEVADPISYFKGVPGELRVVKVKSPVDKIRKYFRFKQIGKLFSLSKGANHENSLKINIDYPPPDQVIPFAADAYTSGRILSFVGFLVWIIAGLMRGFFVIFQEKIDLVCGFETHGAPIARLLGWVLRVPIFTKYQGTFLGTCLPSKSKMFINYPVHYVGTYPYADLIFMEDDGTEGAEVLELIGHSPENIRTRIAGVKKDIWTPNMEREKILTSFGVPVGPQVRIILTLSKISRWKRLDRAISAMPAVLEELPDVFLVVTHRGAERERLEAMAHELGVSSHVIFTGPVLNRDVKFLLNACDVFLSVQDHGNLTNSLLDALECGKPIITIDDGSTSDYVIHEKNALLVQRERIQVELPNAIIRVLKDDTYRNELARASRKVAVEKLLSWEDRMALEVQDIMNLLNKNDGNPTPAPLSDH